MREVYSTLYLFLPVLTIFIKNLFEMYDKLLGISPGCFCSLGIKQRTNDGWVWCKIAISL